jgi:hypothetical protein
MMKPLRQLFVLFVIPLLVACASHQGFVTETMNDADFVKASSEVKSQYLKVVKEESELLDSKKNVEYQSGRPVSFGDGDTWYVKQWDKAHKVVYVYPANSPGGTGIETQSILSMRTDERGDLIYDQSGRPLILLANVATQEELGRVLIKGAFQVLGAGVNGALAAKIQADASCGDNCGNTTLINAGGSSSAAALSETVAQSVLNAAFQSSCPSGNCEAVPIK